MSKTKILKNYKNYGGIKMSRTQTNYETESDFRLTGKTLKMLRHAFDYRQQELSDESRVAISQISKAETNKYPLSKMQTDKILKVWCLTPQEALNYHCSVKQFDTSIFVENLRDKGADV